MGETEIESRIAGEEFMKEMQQLAQVGYVRFAPYNRELKVIDPSTAGFGRLGRGSISRTDAFNA